MAASTSGVGPSMSASGAFGEKILAWPWGVGASVFFSGPVSSSFISTSEPAATGSFGGGVPGADTVSGAVAGMGSERKMFSGLYQQSPQTPVLPWMQLGQIHALQFEHLFIVRFMQLSLLHFCPCSGGAGVLLFISFLHGNVRGLWRGRHIWPAAAPRAG